MDRRDFLKYSATGLASLAAGGAATLEQFIQAAAAAGPVGGAWKFGVMADTQWKANLDGKNPGTCAVGVITALNAQFIQHGVEFAIQVGDLVDVEYDALNGNPSMRTMPVRAAAAQPLYDAGIGFFPLRGNHEKSQLAALEFQGLYPQTRGVGGNVKKAGNFSSPFATLDGLSYSFDYDGVRFVMLDQFTRADATGSTDDNMVDQVPWVDEVLSDRASDSHAIVLSHKNLIGQNHTDTLFGSNPTSNLDARNEFIRSMAANGARYQLGGHDHMHNRSIIESPDGSAYVNQLICSSNSYKFYLPTRPSRDETYNFPRRERNVVQELFTIGYYIFTVDGPRVTVDYYSSSHGLDYDDYNLTATPENMVFFKQETFGYSLNGKEFLIGQGESYAPVQDSFGGTNAAILDGTNQCAVTDRSLRPLIKNVNTGWSVAASGDMGAASHTLTLWNMADNLALWDYELVGLLPGSNRTSKSDTFVLSMSYVEDLAESLGNGRFGIAARAEDGTWVNAVDRNFGGTKKFVKGPWGPDYELGTYGVDPRTKTAWAVVNYEGDFAVRRGLELAPGHRK
jgi:hypothetical protein